VPSFVGGRCKCEEKGGCVGGVANDDYTPKKGPEKPAGEKKGWFWE
jgi:hypothetical protein